MTGSRNAIVGTSSSPLDLPVKETETLNEDKASLQSAARFSQSTEFQQLKEIIDEKIKAWQQYVPGPSKEILAGDRVDINQLSNEERGYRWLAADYVITELRGLISAYEQAAELLKDETAK